MATRTVPPHNTSYLAYIALTALALAAGVLTASAQVPTAGEEILLTWQATRSYVPADYAGRILASQNSIIRAAVDVFLGGKSVDLASVEINWLLGNKLLATGVGRTSFEFPASETAGSAHLVTVRMALRPGDPVVKSIRIPNVSPDVVIDAPFPLGMSPGNAVLLSAVPYFFSIENTSELTFRWSVSGRVRREGPGQDEIELALPPVRRDTKIAVDLQAFSELNSLLKARDSIQLTVKGS